MLAMLFYTINAESFALQDITVHDSSFCQFKYVNELFPVGENVFMLGWPHYGCQGEVVDIEETENPKIRINVIIPTEPNIDEIRQSQQVCRLTELVQNPISLPLGLSYN